MRIPEYIRKCVVYIGYSMFDGSKRYAGTGFLLSHRFDANPPDGLGYLVTAGHVISKIKDKAIDKILIRFNFKNGRADWVETELRNWVLHPDKTVDVAVYNRLGDISHMDHLCYPLAAIATQEKISKEVIGAGEEVFLAGLFGHHAGDVRNIPIIRVGNIAAMPEEPVATKLGLSEVYLIEARSLGGLSGSPVFVHLGAVRNEGGALKLSAQSEGVFFLLGLMHGHWNISPVTQSEFDSMIVGSNESEKTVNMGIGIVVPGSKILEVLEMPEVKEYRDKANEERVQAAKRGLPQERVAD